MWGAVIGDLAGSIYEYNQTKEVKPIKLKNIIDNKSFFSDDTILTIAIADAILNNCNYENKLKEYALKYENYKPNFTPYFNKAFSPNFLKWAKGNTIGTSTGNGAMMRISPIGFWFDSEEKVIENARLATIPSHNSQEAIQNATTVALIIFYARKGLAKEQIIEKLNISIRKPKIEKFNYTCKSTIDLCIYSLFNSSSFEEAIKLAISFGGDTDTNACIVGSMAQAFYKIDDNLKQKAKEKLPNEFIKILEQFDKNLKH